MIHLIPLVCHAWLKEQNPNKQHLNVGLFSVWIISYQLHAMLLHVFDKYQKILHICTMNMIL
jgi:hypothetical protein